MRSIPTFAILNKVIASISSLASMDFLQIQLSLDPSLAAKDCARSFSSSWCRMLSCWSICRAWKQFDQTQVFWQPDHEPVETTSKKRCNGTIESCESNIWATAAVGLGAANVGEEKVSVVQPRQPILISLCMDLSMGWASNEATNMPLLDCQQRLLPLAKLTKINDLMIL